MDAKNNPASFMLSVLFMCFSLKPHLSLGADRITAIQSLSGDHTVVSAGGVFKLGFFKPSGNHSNYYIGIWYGKLSQQTIVWVANRGTPVSDRFTSKLKISDGNLVLFNESKSPIWSTNLSFSPSSHVEAELLDAGNLVLREGSNSLEPLWQSFDHPTDTWLPGAKVGLNRITKRNTLLTSWESREDPAPGLFSLELDPNGTAQYFILWNMSRRFWTSGTWNGQVFSSIPGMGSNFIYYFSYVNNENESYFTYSLYNSFVISRFVMGVEGQIEQHVWMESEQQWRLFWTHPRVKCDVYAYCGAFASCNKDSIQYLCNCLRRCDPKSVDKWNSKIYSQGCVRRTNLRCGNDRFFASDDLRTPANADHDVTVGSKVECELACLSNCSCTAYTFDGDRCSIWLGDLLDLQQIEDDDPNGIILYVRLAATEFSGSKSNNGMVIGAVVGSVFIIVLPGLVLFVIWRKSHGRIKVEKVVDGSLVNFGYRYLQIATNNFSEKLGGGGFGSVFKGVPPDSSVIAVKKLESISQGEKQFRAEISIIGTIQHVNLVRLRGFCSDGARKLLVYDYMPNGSLHSHLFHEKSSYVLDWKTRYQIALGTARGLAYLHEECRDCIIHCDIKPDNILLDADFSPKVADFGLAKLFGHDFSRVLTTMRGTIGYLAPEWISGVAVTAKADVYSYGMMLFEIISGRRNTEQQDGKTGYFPLKAATVLHEDGNVLSLLDPRLETQTDTEEVTRICKVACWCIQYDEKQRPSMSQVVLILQRVLDVSLPPIPNFLQVIEDGSFSR